MPKDLSTRISYFYCASALSGAFSGLLAAGIAEMDGVAGLEGWRWIFLLEGIVTVVLGAACFFFLIDTPALSSRWLEPEEIRFLELSMFIKQGGGFQEENTVRWKDIKMVLTNWRVYVQAYFLLCQSALSYGLSAQNITTNLTANSFQVPSSLCHPSQRLWASATPTLSLPLLPHTSPLLSLPFALPRSPIVSSGACLSSLFP